MNKAGEKEVRVKPYLENVWMTDTQLRVDAELPSKYYMKPKSPANPARAQLGVLTVELLEMEGLKAADFITRNSDPYAVIVFEDCMAKTGQTQKPLAYFIFSDDGCTIIKGLPWEDRCACTHRHAIVGAAGGQE